MSASLSFAAIDRQENLVLSDLIRITFNEFKITSAAKQVVKHELDLSFERFESQKAVLWVAFDNGIKVGCCAIYPSEGLPKGCAELTKLYVSPDARGKGIGKRLMMKCIRSASELGFKQLYLESFSEFDKAVSMYHKAGFKPTEKPLRATGPFACDLWMLMDL